MGPLSFAPPLDVSVDVWLTAAFCFEQVATLYDMLDALDETNVDAKGIPFTVRSVFVIDPKGIIRLLISYPACASFLCVRVRRGRHLTDFFAFLTDSHWPTLWRDPPRCALTLRFVQTSRGSTR